MKIILFYVSPSSPPLSILSKISTTQENISVSIKNLLFLLKKATSSASVWWGNTKSSFKENARTFSKSSTTQEIRISKPKKDYEICTKRKFRTKNQTND